MKSKQGHKSDMIRSKNWIEIELQKGKKLEES